MCGIAGIIDSTLSRDSGDCLLKKMLESMRYRGPDNSSTWVDMPVLLGHNRLSIIDLSDDADQPILHLLDRSYMDPGNKAGSPAEL